MTAPTFNQARAAFMNRAAAPHIPPHALKLAYLICYKYMNRQSGTAHPSQDTLARDLNASIRTVQRLLDILKPLGLAIVLGHGPNRVSTYWIEPEKATPMSPIKTTPVSPIEGGKGDIRRQKRRHLTTEKATPVSPKPYKKNQEEEPREESKTQAPDFFEPDSPHFSTPDSSSAAKKKTKRTAREIDESFAEFWRAYPKRVEKEAARKAFAAAIKRGVAPELMIEGAKRYTVERSGQEAKYTKHPARWLNAGCYADEPSAAAGAVIDQHGNLVAAIEPQQAAQPRGSVVAVAEALAEHLEKHGGDF